LANERKFVVENIRRVLLKEYLMKETERAGFGGLDIQRTPIGTRISLFIERPGLVIGRQGGAIKSLTETLEKEFQFDNPQIEVQEVENPSLNAQIMAEKLAVALERGWHFRRAGHSTVRRIMDSGARGCQVVLSGKLTGQRHRTEKFKEGHIKHCGEPSKKFMKDGFAVAKLKLGIIGVKVQIMDADSRLPDDIEIEAALAVEGEEPEVPAAVEGEAAIEGEAPAEEAPTEAVPSEEAKAEEPATAVETTEAPAEEPKVEAKPETAEAPKPEEPGPKAEPPAPLEEKKKEEPKEKPKEKERRVRDGKDIKSRKLKKVARKLEKIGEDVDLHLKEEQDEDREEKEEKEETKEKEEKK
jgi:small subunit ribosomal protein S3